MRRYRIFLIVLVYITCCIFITVYALAANIKLRAGHVIPVEKKLSRSDLKRMFNRGEPDVWTGKDLETIGMPVGGIAAGQLYLRGDGTLGQWWIFNKHNFTGYGAKAVAIALAGTLCSFLASEAMSTRAPAWKDLPPVIRRSIIGIMAGVVAICIGALLIVKDGQIA